MNGENHEDPAVRSSRREALIVFIVWLSALTYSVGYCKTWGYGLSSGEIAYKFGFPSWFLWGIVLPWVVCAFVTWAFAYLVMQDDSLGENTEFLAGESQDTAGRERNDV